MSSATEVYTPGPLPVIGAVCEEAGVVETINKAVEWDQQQCLLSPGHRITALIMNVLTEGQPMYRLPEFFRETDTENLFGEGISPDHLNDDALGRALDKLATADPRTVGLSDARCESLSLFSPINDQIRTALSPRSATLFRNIIGINHRILRNYCADLERVRNMGYINKLN